MTVKSLPVVRMLTCMRSLGVLVHRTLPQPHPSPRIRSPWGSLGTYHYDGSHTNS